MAKLEAAVTSNRADFGHGLINPKPLVLWLAELAPLAECAPAHPSRPVAPTIRPVRAWHAAEIIPFVMAITSWAGRSPIGSSVFATASAVRPNGRELLIAQIRFYRRRSLHRGVLRGLDRLNQRSRRSCLRLRRRVYELSLDLTGGARLSDRVSPIKSRIKLET
jgi:hypothetical protein